MAQKNNLHTQTVQQLAEEMWNRMEQSGSKYSSMGCLIKIRLVFLLQQMAEGYIFLINFGLQETFIEGEARAT